MPDIIELHTSSFHVSKWIKYGVLDSELTFLLYHTFKTIMEKLDVKKYDLKTIWDLYEKYWLPFGECLTELERTGIKVNKEHLMVNLKEN